VSKNQASKATLHGPFAKQRNDLRAVKAFWEENIREINETGIIVV